MKRASGGRLSTRHRGRFIRKGVATSVAVHDRVGLTESARPPDWHREFEQALNLFQQRDFGAAQMSFERVLESANDENTTRFYLKHLKEVVANPPPENWSGEVELKEK